MSIQGVPTHLQLDPRIHPGQPEYTITKGPIKSVYTPYTSQNFSNQQLQFQVFPNSMGTFLDRKLLVEMQVDFTLTATNPLSTIFPGGNPAASGVIGLRYMPLHNVANTFQATINGNVVSNTTFEIIAPFSQYNTPTDPLEQLNWSFMPACKNVGQSYADTFGTPRSQFASQYENVYQDSNAVTSNMSIISQVAGTTVVRCHWCEIIPYAPFINGVLEREGLVGLNSALILNWVLPGLERFIGYDNVNGTPLSSISATWAVPPVLRCNWLTAPISGALNMNQGMAYKYPYANIQIFQNTPVPVASNATQTLTYSNVQLTGIPQAAFIFAREQVTDRTPFDADSFAVIESLNIQFNNMTGILSGASQYDLYKIAVRNGLKQRYSDWASIYGGGVGSVLKVEFDRDIPLGDPALAVGRMGTYQWSGTVNVTNPSAASINYVLYLIVVYEGILTVVDGSCMTQINLVSGMDVLQSSGDDNSSNIDVAISEANRTTIEGGSIISSAQNFVARGQKFYGAHKNTIDSVLKVGKQVGLGALELLPVLLGAGMSYEEAADRLQGAGFSGGGLSGGRLITDPSTLLRGSMQVPITRRNR